MTLPYFGLRGVEPRTVSVGEIFVVIETALNPADVNGISVESRGDCAKRNVLLPPGLSQIIDPGDGMWLVEMPENLTSNRTFQDADEFGGFPALGSLSNNELTSTGITGHADQRNRVQGAIGGAVTTTR